MAEGKVTIPYGRFLGYRKGADGLPEIIPEEAETVRLIYRSFMEGMTPGKIVKMLMQMDIPAPGGGDKWYTHIINSILTNEKYKGSAIFQKKFTASCREITEALCDSAALDKQIENLLVRADELTAVMQGFIRKNAEHEQDQDLYNQKYAE